MSDEIQTNRLMTVAKASWAAHAAVIRVIDALDALKASGHSLPAESAREINRMLHTASAALSFVPGQLNHFVPADSNETIAAAQAEFGLNR